MSSVLFRIFFSLKKLRTKNTSLSDIEIVYGLGNGAKNLTGSKNSKKSSLDYCCFFSFIFIFYKNKHLFGTQIVLKIVLNISTVFMKHFISRNEMFLGGDTVRISRNAFRFESSSSRVVFGWNYKITFYVNTHTILNTLD